jgi:hypothetical protein
MIHDVFISFATEDEAAALGICGALEAEGIACWIAHRNIQPGAEYRRRIVEAIEGCRLLILVFSAHANASNYVTAEVDRAFNKGIPILSFRLQAVPPSEDLALMISGRHWLEAWKTPWDESLLTLSRAVRSLLAGQGPAPGGPATPPQAPLKLVLSYRRNAQPDQDLVRRLEQALGARGHDVFVDRQMRVGIEWAREIEARVRSADALIPLLSAASVQSEMLTYEVQTAHDEAQKRGGTPRLLPVRVAFAGELPPELAATLGQLPNPLWEGPQDDRRLIEELTEALRHPRPIPPTRPMPVGGLPLDSESYVVRAADGALRAALDRRDSIILLRGARQMGKTSSLALGLRLASSAGAAVAFTDLQKLNRSELETPEALYRALGAGIAVELDLDVFPEDVWDARRAPNTNFERYLRREILEKIDRPLVWAIDEADRLFSCAFGSEVFGLFRSWHNARAMNPTGPWRRLTLVIVYATEAHLFITDVNQSPFNVGTLIALEDFTPEQVADLNGRYGSPLCTDAERASYDRLVGGQPYLVHRGLFEMAEQGVDVAAFVAQAERDEGFFGDHLRRILVLLAEEPGLCDAVREVLQGRACPDLKSFYRLRAAGVLAGTSARDARPRCQLYATYLKKHLT